MKSSSLNRYERKTLLRPVNVMNCEGPSKLNGEDEAQRFFQNARQNLSAKLILIAKSNLDAAFKKPKIVDTQPVDKKIIQNHKQN